MFFMMPLPLCTAPPVGKIWKLRRIFNGKKKNSTNLISLNLCYITPLSNGEQLFVVSVSGHERQMWNDLSLIDCLARSKHYAAMKA